MKTYAISTLYGFQVSGNDLIFAPSNLGGPVTIVDLTTDTASNYELGAGFYSSEVVDNHLVFLPASGGNGTVTVIDLGGSGLKTYAISRAFSYQAVNNDLIFAPSSFGGNVTIVDVDTGNANTYAIGPWSSYRVVDNHLVFSPPYLLIGGGGPPDNPQPIEPEPSPVEPPPIPPDLPPLPEPIDPPETPPGTSEPSFTPRVTVPPHSGDPNNLVGPTGLGDEQWVSASAPLNYEIQFENDPAIATGPAQQIRITETLDPDLDPRTFRLGDFALGNIVVAVPDNQAFYSTRLDLTSTLGIYVDVAAGVDIATSSVFWQFTSIDPATGEIPTDKSIGLLPVNVTNPEGEGYADYSVRTKQSAATGDHIGAQATIVFDNNPSLNTPTVTNTLDATSPTSAVATLPPSEDDQRFQVDWSGGDGDIGSGLASYNVYVSTNGGPFSLWLDHTTLTNAEYLGVFGNTYAFYSQSTDGVGNVEAAHTTADAQTVIGVLTPAAPELSLGSDLGVSNADHLTSDSRPKFNGSGVAGDQIEIFANGNLIAQGPIDDTGHYSMQLSAPLGSGTYTITADQVDAGDSHSPMSDAMFPNLVIDTIQPTAQIAAVSPSIRNTAIDQLSITFSEPIGGFSLTNLQLNLNGGVNLLTGSQSLTTSDNGMTWTLGNLTGLTLASGNYTLTLLSAGIGDEAGNSLAAGQSTSWLSDFAPPTSKVSPLPQRQNSLSFSVSASGSDGTGGSGVGSYDLYVSTNGGPFVLWTTIPAATPMAMFTAQSNTTYAFHSIAHDSASNVEMKGGGVIEASTYVPDLTPPVTQITSAVPSAAGAISISFSGRSPGGSGVKSILLSVRVDNGPIVQIGQFMPGDPTAGVYPGQATYQGITDGNSHTYLFSIQGTNGNGVQEAGHIGSTVMATFQTPVVPQATGFIVEKGLSERSYIRYLDVTFNEPISQLTLDTTHVILKEYGLDGTTFLRNIDLTGKIHLIDHVMEIDFGAGGIGGNENLANTLANWNALVADDGYYKLLIDPDGTGTHPIEEDFYRLFGDVIGNVTRGPTVTGPVSGSSNVIGAVTNNDLNAIASALGQTASSQNPLLNADVNGAGSVTANDRILVAKSLSAGRSLASGLHLDD